jgi:hypothetical protein
MGRLNCRVKLPPWPRDTYPLQLAVDLSGGPRALFGSLHSGDEAGKVPGLYEITLEAKELSLGKLMPPYTTSALAWLGIKTEVKSATERAQHTKSRKNLKDAGRSL